MFGTRTLARTLLASTFVAGGWSALRAASRLAPTAEPVAGPLKERLGLDVDTETLVRANAGVQVAGGALLALGIAPRPVAAILAASLVPTTLAAHRFWDADDDLTRSAQLHEFLKGAGLIGGLMFAVLDTGGRPSIFWSGRRAALGAGEAIGATARSLVDAVTPS